MPKDNHHCLCLVKQIRVKKYPGQLPSFDLLVVFAHLFRVVVIIHFGGNKPIIYTSTTSDSNARVHLQCLPGIHFNPVKEVPQYHLPIGIEITNQVVQDEVKYLEDIPDNDPGIPLSSLYTRRGNGVIMVEMGSQLYCSLLASGTH